ncbi:MAG: hypothetical protein IKX62_00635 [Bacteroidales bacterium]|nr:hypothetical protein [Bacteroidales bacterium]
MTTEDIERLSLEELQRMAEDLQTPVPEALPDRLQAMASAASLAEKGAEALADKPGATALRQRPARWLWGAVPAVALAAVAVFLFVRKPQRPKDTFTDPTLAYIEMSRAFAMFQEAVQHANQPIENNQITNGL